MARLPSTYSTTWANTAAGIFGAIATIIAAIITILTASGNIDAISNHVWQIASLAEFTLISALFLVLVRKFEDRIPSPSGVGDIDSFRAFAVSYLASHKKSLEELRTGRISLYGIDIRRSQILLFELAREKARSREIIATDITQSPQMWDVRPAYFDANRSFVAHSGGRIRRIFLVTHLSLADVTFARNLKNQIDLHRHIGVETGLHVIDRLPKDCVEDYVVFYNACVMIEVEQADREFQRGRTDFDFREISVNLYTRKFEYLWQKNDTQGARELAIAFDKVMEIRTMDDAILAENLRKFLVAAW